MDQRRHLTQGGRLLGQGMDRLARGDIHRDGGDVEPGVAEHLRGRLGVLQPEVGEHDVRTRADPASDRLADQPGTNHNNHSHLEPFAFLANQ